MRERDQIFIDPFRGPSALLFIKAFTLWSIYVEVTLFTAFATLVVLLDEHIPRLNLSLPPTLLTVLGTVIGFVLSYRTSSAYERYTEGRKQWSTIVHVSRALSRVMWYFPHVIRLPTENRPATDDEQMRSLIEKKSFINLIEGFAVSLKHYLRGEHSIYYEDLYHLACFLPKFTFHNGHSIETNLEFRDQVGRGLTPSRQPSEAIRFASPNESSITIEQESEEYQPHTNSKIASPFPPSHQLLPSYNPHRNRFSDHLPWAILKSIWKGTKNVTGLRRKKSNYSRRIHDDNIPLEMISCMYAYVATLRERKVLDVPTSTSFNNSILSLSDSLATLERILSTPIPFGYIVHLRLIIWGYLTFLPFQILSTFGYITIPAVALISIAFLGFLQIGQEIENPFGYDSNDLDMDHFCQNIIARELSEVTALPPPTPGQFIFSPFNIPLFRHKDHRSAVELTRTYSSSADIQLLLHQKYSFSKYEGTEN